jgi:hypothetical protein
MVGRKSRCAQRAVCSEDEVAPDLSLTPWAAAQIRLDCNLVKNATLDSLRFSPHHAHLPLRL